MNESMRDSLSPIESAARILRSGGVLSHACEGVWGLACDPFNKSAVERVCEIKQRIPEKGFILIGSDSSVFSEELEQLFESKRNQIKQSWPGHVTWIIPTSRMPSWITGGRNTIAVRVPAHEQARWLCQTYGGPLVSTSANISDDPAATTQSEVQDQFESLVDLILPGEIGEVQGSSRIIDATTGKILR